MRRHLRRLGCRLLGHRPVVSAANFVLMTKREGGGAEPDPTLVVYVAGFSVTFPTQVTWERHSRTSPVIICRRCGCLLDPGEDR